MKPAGTSVAAVLRSLAAHGPQTSFELAQTTGIDSENLRGVIARMHRTTTRTPKRIYVSRWVDFVEGVRVYTRAEYSIGDLEDARKRKRSSAQIKRDWRRLHKRRLMLSRNQPIVASSGMWSGLLS